MKPATKHTDDKSIARVPIRRAAPLAGVLIAIGLLASACGGGSPRDPGSGSSRAQAARQALAFSVCMRTHGVSDFPDPQISGSGGGVTATVTATAHGGSAGVLNHNSPASNAAFRACRNLLPNGGSQIGGATNRTQQRSQGLQFAGCMRANGIADFPDPSADGMFNLPSDINQQAPQFRDARQACANAQPNYLSINQGGG